MRIKSSLVSLSSVSPLGLLGLRCDSCVARCGHGLPVCLSLSPSSPPPKRRDLSGVADVIETLHVGVCMCMCKYVCVRSPIQTRCFQPDAWAQKRLMISSTRARIIINIEPSQRQTTRMARLLLAIRWCGCGRQRLPHQRRCDHEGLEIAMCFTAQPSHHPILSLLLRFVAAKTVILIQYFPSGFLIAVS